MRKYPEIPRMPVNEAVNSMNSLIQSITYQIPASHGDMLGQDIAKRVIAHYERNGFYGIGVYDAAGDIDWTTTELVPEDGAYWIQEPGCENMQTAARLRTIPGISTVFPHSTDGQVTMITSLFSPKELHALLTANGLEFCIWLQMPDGTEGWLDFDKSK